MKKREKKGKGRLEESYDKDRKGQQREGGREGGSVGGWKGRGKEEEAL